MGESTLVVGETRVELKSYKTSAKTFSNDLKSKRRVYTLNSSAEVENWNDEFKIETINFVRNRMNRGARKFVYTVSAVDNVR